MPLAPHLSAEKRDDVLDLRFRTLRGIGLGGFCSLRRAWGAGFENSGSLNPEALEAFWLVWKA